MNPHLQSIIQGIGAIARRSDIKAKRGWQDFLADRIRQAATAADLLAFGERLMALVDSPADCMRDTVLHNWVVAASRPEAPALLRWLGAHPRVAAQLAAAGDKVDLDAVSVDLGAAAVDPGAAEARGDFDIGIEVSLRSPLAHGADAKAGNATLLRRCDVISSTGVRLSLPFYGGNALGGCIRDLLGDHLLGALGIDVATKEAVLAPWFFDLLYTGGRMHARGKTELPDAGDTEAADALLGKHGSIRSDGVREFRCMLPGVSVLGCCVANRLICGRINLNDLRPRCREWGQGDAPVATLVEWQYLTRREDREQWEADDHGGMIAMTECLQTGVRLEGGIDISPHADEVERGALAKGLMLLAAGGYLGAQNRRGLGRVRIEYAGLPDPKPFEKWARAAKKQLRPYLEQMGAFA